MKDISQLESISQEEFDSTLVELENIVKGITKNEISSVKGMVLPPMFSFNVLKLAFMLLNPQVCSQEITWVKIKKELLSHSDIIQRKTDSFQIREFEDEEIEEFQKNCKEIFTPFGNNIESKSELYGSFVHKMCKFCLRARTILHSSKFLRIQD